MRILTIVVLLASAAGFGFSAVSTFDFAAHLDRQVHGIHCSFLPGLSESDTSGSSGCHVTLMSPYSSVMRDSVWGGIPISLPSMSVFSFLFFWAAWLALRRRQDDSRATGFLFLATCLPAASSAGMGYLSLATLDAACKLCIGIYSSSSVVFVAALVLWMQARKQSAFGKIAAEDGADKPRLVSWAILLLSFCLGLVFVGAPFATYASVAPDFTRYVGSCGELEYRGDTDNILVPLGPQTADVSMIEVLDPLCPSCRGFEERFAAMPIKTQVSRQAMLFPLDSECNWMIDHSIHPGACAVSEAMLCAGDDAEAVLSWAFEHQEDIMEAAGKDPATANRLVAKAFPKLRNCVGSPPARARLNLALRWAVKNRLMILTPQIYLEGLRLCDEDTDLGLDYALPRLLEKAKLQPPPKVEDKQRALPPAPFVRRTPKPARQPGAAPAPKPAADPSSDEPGAVDPIEPEAAQAVEPQKTKAADEPAGETAPKPDLPSPDAEEPKKDPKAKVSNPNPANVEDL